MVVARPMIKMRYNVQLEQIDLSIDNEIYILFIYLRMRVEGMV